MKKHKKTAAHGCGSFFISVLLLAQSAQQGIAEFMGRLCQYGRPGQYGKGSRQADNEEIPAGSGQKGAGQCPGHLQERFGGDTAEEHDDEKNACRFYYSWAGLLSDWSIGRKSGKKSPCQAGNGRADKGFSFV